MSVKNILLFDETIFKNIDAFNPDYVPENYLHRESQMEALAICLRPALMGGRPINTVVLGSPATGKTTAINKIFNIVEMTSDKIVCRLRKLPAPYNPFQHILTTIQENIRTSTTRNRRTILTNL